MSTTKLGNPSTYSSSSQEQKVDDGDKAVDVDAPQTPVTTTSNESSAEVDADVDVSVGVDVDEITSTRHEREGEGEKKEAVDVDVDVVATAAVAAAATATTKKEEPLTATPKTPDNTPTSTSKPSEAPNTPKATKTDHNDDSSDDDDTPLPTMPRRRSSIKLKSLVADIPVIIRKNSFRTLPKPDMDKVRRAATLPAYMNPEDVFAAMSGTNHEEDRTNLSVRFDNVSIRSYQQTLGDNPSVSYGPPIALDWKYEEDKPKSLEEYEKEREPNRRPFPKLGLNYYQRKALLEQQGHSDQELRSAKKQANKDKFKRAVTKYFLPVQHLEDAAESAGRKIKKIMGHKRRKSFN